MKKLYDFFASPLLIKHRALTQQDNCKMLEMFELMFSLCALCMLISGFADEYFRSLRYVYVGFIVVNMAVYFLAKYYIEKHLRYTVPMMMVNLVMMYVFCIFSGIIYNIDGPSITIFAFQIFACCAYLLPLRFTIFFHTAATAIYCVLAIVMKPAYGMTDALSCALFLIMALSFAGRLYQIRLDYLNAVDDAISQRDKAQSSERLERELRISERKLYEESSQRQVLDAALAEANQVSDAKSRFLSRMSHEIRTPINAVIGIAELEQQDIEAGRIDKEKLSEYMEEITSSAKYLLTLVNDVLDSSKIDSGNFELHPYPITAGEYLKSIATMAKPLAAAGKIDFTIERATFVHEHYIADGIRVQQIIMNVLSNAFKFTPPGGKVTMRCEALDKTERTTTLRFTVTDTGIGMSEEFQKKIFDSFTQEHDTNTSKFSGSGLGMNISRELARMMNGDITCQSEKGKGSTFTITLVVGNAEEPVAPALKTEETAHEHTNMDLGGVRVLLCEDHPLNQKITRALLERKNCAVDIACDGAMGVEMFENSVIGYYAMILMDIRMPNMDGYEATRAIRSLGRTDSKTVPIIAMSANAYAEDVQQSLDAGMNAHLAKPVDAALLYQTVSSYTRPGFSDEKSIKPKIIFADDIEMSRALGEKILSEQYEVLLAANGREALELLEKNQDCVALISDIQMPEIDGTTLINRIRSDERYDSMAIIAVTQFGDVTQEKELVTLGADDFIYKPISPTLVTVRLRNVIASRQQHL